MKSTYEKIVTVYNVRRYTDILEETYSPVTKSLSVIPF
jgi:hypothetical protein